jgi:hypothetical protein
MRNLTTEVGLLPFGIKDLGLLEDLRDDGHGGVDRVGDDADESRGAVLTNGVCQVAHDTGIDLRSKSVMKSELPWARSAP